MHVRTPLPLALFDGSRASAYLKPQMKERLKTIPGISDRPVTSRSQESTGARMGLWWLFFMAYVRNSVPF